MSFGGGFGGFGQNNNNTGSAFGSGGAFGSNNNTNSGFGSTGFGSTSNTGSNLFGGNTSSGFGGFGSNNTNTTFGAKPFGGTGTNLFGGGSSASGTGTFGGGFGSTANNTTSAFGNTNTGGGIFGAGKPAFGGSTTGTGGMFGGGTTGGFGSTNTTGGFGASPAGAFGNSAQTAPNNGTANPPFTATIEKDGTSATQHFQTITFQPAYSNYSLEELRMVDYAQGRRYGNQNGQAGAFGQSTGFGGFGSTNTNTSTGFGANANANTGGNLFGGTNTSTGFGSTNTGTGFGSTANTGSNLFGGSKPGGVFGSTATSQPTTNPFGASTTTSAFGGGNTGFGSTNTNTGSNLFGGGAQTQNKPFGGFGSGTGTTTGGFGSTGNTGFGQTNTSTGLFGQTNQASAAPAFGSTPATTNTGGSVFGGFGQNQQSQAQPASGGLFGGGGFGQNQNQQNQNKPGGLFGGGTTAGTTGTSLFGQQNNQTPQTGSIFGGTNNQTSGTSLFGNKPATTGTNLFGASTNSNTTGGGGLFGNLNSGNQQQTQGSTLFGQQNQQKPLFGGSTATNTNTGSSLFGNLGQNNANTSNLSGSTLFGNQSQQQTNQQSQNNNSIFGTPGNSVLQTSLNVNPYGHDALFAGLTTPTQSPGPLATPLSSNNNSRKSAILPQHKLNPAASTRLLTPQRRTGGFGFTYSTYGTPNSASSSTSPGLSSTFLGGGSLSRSLGRSLSTSNLRNSYTPEMSILAPGAFSTNSRSFAGGSLKKLNVNRSINTRTPLFGNDHENSTHGTIKKTVSFDKSITDSGEPEVNGSTSTALVRTEPRDESRDEVPGRSTSNPFANGTNGVNGAASRPEMQEANGNLTPVPENSAPLRTASASSLNTQKQSGDKDAVILDPRPGTYWMRPTLEELKRMSRQELKAVPNFTVGRTNIGQIEFGLGKPVDLSNTDLDKIVDDIVVLSMRNATAFGEKCSIPKPPVGTGLNVPSRITLENSWTKSGRGKEGVKLFPSDGIKFTKHLNRLKRVANTHFENYIPETGAWIFTVDHYSSYGLDDDDEDEDMDTSALSAPPDTPTQFRSSQMTGTPQEDSFVSPSQSSPDDTFDFKKGRRSRASLPGGFDEETAYDEDVGESVDNSADESFLGERSTGSFTEQHDADSYSESESVEDQDMADSVSGPVQTVEHPAAKELNPFAESLKPKSILKASQAVRPGLGTPSKNALIFDDDWANQLQRTISPKKQDREALRQSQGAVLKERDGFVPQLAQSLNGPTIATSIDLMKSLFGDTKQGQTAARSLGKGIEV